MLLRSTLKSLSLVRKLSSKPYIAKATNRIYENKTKVFGFATATGIVCMFYLSRDAHLQAKEEKRKKLVILGSGWAAVSLIKTLKPEVFDVTVVSPTNYFLYTPLLPSVSVGTVDGRTLVEPIRKILNKRHKNGVEYFEAECTDIDIENQMIVCQDKSAVVGEQTEFKIDYDVLVVAVGSKTATYNNKEIEKYAHKLKNMKQAQEIRSNIMDSLESAAIPGQSSEEVKRLLNFVVVGGGPTGVEFASELRDFIHTLKKLYPPELIEQVKITLVNSHYKVLSMFDAEISRFTDEKFKSDGINVVGGSYVVGIDNKCIQIKNKQSKAITEMPYGMCVWAAGIAPREITKTMITKIPGQNNRNGLVTDAYLKVKHANNIFGVGDCATVEFTKLLSQVKRLFKQADKDGNGSLSLDEFADFLTDAKSKFPEMTQHLNKLQKSLHKTFAAMDTDNDQRLSITEFKTFLSEVDNKLKAYPATAQLAAQQGKYIGQLLSNHPDVSEHIFKEEKPFVYSHLGNFAYVGGDRAVLQLPVIGSVTGWATMWLWRAAYLNQAVSWRMEFLIGLDWMKAHIFGRDTSRI